MILLFIYQTYNSHKLDKKNQSIHKETLKLRQVDGMLHYSKYVLALVQMYYQRYESDFFFSLRPF